MTAASSDVSAPTRTRASESGGSWRRTCARSSGPILQAQPAPWLSVVRRISAMDLLLPSPAPVVGNNACHPREGVALRANIQGVEPAERGARDPKPVAAHTVSDLIQ